MNVIPINEHIISLGNFCPAKGKNVCNDRGWFLGTALPYCNRFNEFLCQGRTKASKVKCVPCGNATRRASECEANP